jgi:hypothetical protein
MFVRTGERRRVVSRTVTVKLHVFVFALASTAVQLTVVTPMKKVLPEAGTQTRLGAGSHASLTVVV